MGIDPYDTKWKTNTDSPEGAINRWLSAGVKTVERKHPVEKGLEKSGCF